MRVSANELSSQLDSMLKIILHLVVEIYSIITKACKLGYNLAFLGLRRIALNENESRMGEAKGDFTCPPT